MPIKKDNLPLSLDNNDTTGTITYANEVIAIIAGVAANEVEGIAGMCASGGISDVFTRNKNITRGVKVEIGTEEASVDLYVIVEYGTPIQTAATDVQENVRKAIETMTGLHVVRIDVHVQGVSFEKENKEALAGIESLTEPPMDEEAPKQEKLKEEKQKEEKQKEEKPKKEDKHKEERQKKEAPKAEASRESDAQDKACEQDKPADEPQPEREQAFSDETEAADARETGEN